jgi:hypothetical protein
MISFTFRSLHSLDKKLGEPQSRIEKHGEEKNLSRKSNLNLRTHNVFTILTKLPGSQREAVF